MTVFEKARFFKILVHAIVLLFFLESIVDYWCIRRQLNAIQIDNLAVRDQNNVDPSPVHEANSFGLVCW